jgi:uncharacterized protein involved in cysteine biosynthesis
MSARTVPCPLCGYHAPGSSCPHCGLAARDPSLVFVPGRVGRFGDGIAALPRGIALITTTRGVKRWLVPPLVLTSIVYVALLSWAWVWVDRGLDLARSGSAAELDVREGWFSDVLAWIVARDFVMWIAKAGSFVVLLALAALVALWTFSIVYALIASPFLDVVHARIEKRWFGVDPSGAANAGVAMSSARRARILGVCAVVAVVAIGFSWLSSSSRAAWSLCVIPASLVVASIVARDFGAWLGAEIKSQARSLLPGIKASILTSVVLVLCLWMKLIPIVGYFLFAGVAGFASAIGLLDVAFSRRRFDLSQRVSFVVEHAPAVVAFGIAQSVLFIVPVIGPIVGVPTASVGGLWLVCRLDKSGMRARSGGKAEPPRIA